MNHGIAAISAYDICNILCVWIEWGDGGGGTG